MSIINFGRTEINITVTNICKIVFALYPMLQTSAVPLKQFILNFNSLVNSEKYTTLVHLKMNLRLL